MAQLFAETDPTRLRERLAAIVGRDLGPNEVERLARGDTDLLGDLGPVALRGVGALMSPAALRRDGQLEAMIGPSLDYVPTAYLAEARAAASSVVRVISPDERATGFMVGPGLLLTNHHVIETEEAARVMQIEFDYELGTSDEPLPVTRFRLDPDTFFLTSDATNLDYTLIAVGAPDGPGRPLETFGYCPLGSTPDRHAIGDFVTIIEHPSGLYKQIALRENHVLGRGASGTTLYYGADTMPGSSGSPVFNDQFEVVALHHASGHAKDDHFDGGRARIPDETNEGIRISAIVANLRRRASHLPSRQRRRLMSAIDISPVTPALLHESNGHRPEVSRPAHQPTRRVRLERRANAGPDLAGRTGYDEGFLDVRLPLPRPTATLAATVADPDATVTRPPWLPFLHFSTLQSAKHRMPLVTAVNIDGSQARGVNRTTGVITPLVSDEESLEGGDVWYVDDRIDAGEQVTDDWYLTQPAHVFDRGHLVRRLDPCWGSDAVVTQADLDTFHFTNCCPQVAAFNERVTLWAGIENYALENAAHSRSRITVFSGPIFTVHDRVVRDVTIPGSFFKIVARVDDHGELRATAFVASQQKLVDEAFPVDEAFTGDFDDLGPVVEFQSTVAAIERATSLRFGPLRQHDSSRTGGNEAKRLVRVGDIGW